MKFGPGRNLILVLEDSPGGGLNVGPGRNFMSFLRLDLEEVSHLNLVEILHWSWRIVQKEV